MENSGVIPSYIEVAPNEKLYVVYEDTSPLEYGVELTPFQVKNEPKVTWSADPTKFYFLIMVDPDAPSRRIPICGPVNHWMVGNIPGNNLSSANCDVMVEYRGSGPPRGTGLHRYVLLVYEQNGILDFKNAPRSDKFSLKNRPRFAFKDFTKKYNLGNPMAGNYFESQWCPNPHEGNKESRCSII